MEQSNLKKFKDNPVVFCVVTLLAIYISMQLYLLTSVGAKGQDLANIRNQQSKIKVENEILKARILELRSNQEVIAGLQGKIKVEPKSIAIIKPEEFNVAAQY